MTNEERDKASHMAMELLNYFSERHDQLQPKPMVDCLVVALAILIRVSFKEDREEIASALAGIDHDLRETVNHISRVDMTPHPTAGHA